MALTFYETIGDRREADRCRPNKNINANSMQDAEQQQRSHWARFSLRRAFIVCALLCGLLGWIGNLVSQLRREEAALAFLRSRGANVFYKHDSLSEGIGPQAQRRLLKRVAGYP